MTHTITRRRAIALTAAGTLALTTRGALAQDGETLSISVGAVPVPHAEILTFIQETFGEERGIDIEIVEFTDYVQPNVALDEGDIDSNFFQHQPYLDEFNEQRGTDLVSVVPVHEDGDVVLLQRVEPQRSGEVCAVRVGEDESTLKYLEWSPPRSGDRPARYRLRPHNPSYPTLTVPAAELHIDGVMRGLIRGDVVQDLLFEGSG